MCYNAAMRFFAYIFNLLLLLALLPISAGAQTIPGTDRMNVIVITFSPPFAGQLNRSESLFQALLQTMQEKPANLADRINSVGATWSASYNLNGVQFSLLYPGGEDSAISLCRTMLNGLAGKIPGVQNDNSKKSLANYLHSVLWRHLPGNSTLTPASAPVSLFTSSGSSRVKEMLGPDTELFASLYDRSLPLTESGPLVIPEVPVTLYAVLSWNEFSSRSFISAKFIGEKFISENSVGSASYELLNCGNSLCLALTISGDEETLAGSQGKLRQFARQSYSGEGSPLWKGFAARIIRIFSDDRRDLTKSSLFQAWAQHWNGNFSDFEQSEVAFLNPDRVAEGVSMPETRQHELSYSGSTFPRFSACSRSSGSATADVALTFVASRGTLNIINEGIGAESATSFPVSTDNSDPDRLTISFHCHLDQVSGCVARLRSRITGSLFEKGFTGDISSSMQIGIAASCDITPFELRGLLQQGWPPQTQNHEWHFGNDSSVAAAMRVSANDHQAFNRRWAIATATGRGCAEILSLLAARGIALKTLRK